MERTEKIEITVLCMIYNDNRILLINRTKEDWAGMTFPGGHVERNESFVEATIREMKEETGLDVINLKLCGFEQFWTNEKIRYLVVLFKTNEFSGEVASSEEGDVIWVDRKKLSSALYR